MPERDPDLSADEFDVLKEQLGRLHDLYEAALESDGGAQRQRDLGSRRKDMQQKRYIWTETDESVAPVSYDEILWTPMRASLIGRIAVRHPLLRGEKFSVFDDELTVVPNDVLLAVNRQKYLVNSSGIVPYAAGEDLDFDDDEMFRPPHEDGTESRPNVFAVIHSSRRARVLLPSALKAMLDVSEFGQRKNPAS